MRAKTASRTFRLEANELASVLNQGLHGLVLMNIKIRFPLASLGLKDRTGAVFLRGSDGDGDYFFLPIFDSFEDAEDFRERQGWDCITVILSSRNDVLSFVANPPSRSDEHPPRYRVLQNPTGSKIGDSALLWEMESFLAAVNSADELAE